ncbi:MAG: nucleotidyltransferase domain-containing protein [Moorellaceae bacterium]
MRLLHLKEFEQALEILTSAAQEIYGDRLVSLAVFGSVGRGTPRPDSDIDVLVVADGLPRGRLKRIEEFSRVEEIVEARAAGFKYIKPDLSPVIKEREEVLRGSFLFLDLVEDARICYDRENFLALYLAGLREKLRKMGARRIYRGGAWYWVLKPDFTTGEVIEI